MNAEGRLDQHLPLGRISTLTWDDLAQRYRALECASLTESDLPAWLEEWSDLRNIVWERWSVVKSAEGRDLRDEAARLALEDFVENVMTPAEAADQRLGHMLISVQGWEPGPEHEQFVRRQRYSAGIAGEQNVVLASEISTLAGKHEEIAATVTPTLGGRVLSGPEIDRLMQEKDRPVRERAWRAQQEPWLSRRKEIDALFLDILRHRQQLARQAGVSSYRQYAWHELGRLDYTPDDCLHLHDAVALHLVPLATDRYERRRQALGIDKLRPWDLRIDPFAEDPLQPFHDAATFGEALAGVFRRRDRELGELFERMRVEGYVDLEWRPGKRPGGVERPFPLTGLTFVSVNGDGSEINVGTAVHEMGHAYHDYLTMQHCGFEWNLVHTDEFSELAALGMWWLVEPYLSAEHGGFYSPQQARVNRVRLLEELAVQNVPRHARTDALHHWIYSEAPEDVTPEEIDARWHELGVRFEPWIDWTGLEAEESLGWRQHWALFSGPFYEVAYILANLGALQIWQTAESAPEAAWQRYRSALTLGSTASLRDLYRHAGAELPFDPALVSAVAGFVRSQLAAT